MYTRLYSVARLATLIALKNGGHIQQHTQNHWIAYIEGKAVPPELLATCLHQEHDTHEGLFNGHNSEEVETSFVLKKRPSQVLFLETSLSRGKLSRSSSQLSQVDNITNITSTTATSLSQGLGAAPSTESEPVAKKRRYQRPGLPKAEGAVTTGPTAASSSALDSGDIEQKADSASDQGDAPMIEDGDTTTPPTTSTSTAIPTTYSASTASATKPSTSRAPKTPAKPNPVRRASTGSSTTTTATPAAGVYKSSVSTRSAGIKTRSARKPHLRG